MALDWRLHNRARETKPASERDEDSPNAEISVGSQAQMRSVGTQREDREGEKVVAEHKLGCTRQRLQEKRLQYTDKAPVKERWELMGRPGRSDEESRKGRMRIQAEAEFEPMARWQGDRNTDLPRYYHWTDQKCPQIRRRSKGTKQRNSETSCHGTVDRRQGKTQEQ